MAAILSSSENIEDTIDTTSEMEQKEGMSEGIITSPAESTGSLKTVRARSNLQSPEIVLRTPSYPFPPVGVSSKTPMATPPQHLSFMALSPTQPPDQNILEDPKDARSRTADGVFMNSGRVTQVEPSSMASPVDEEQATLPDLYETAIRLQTEPGLTGWWQQTTQILKESIHAIRATLAVPSDKTEIENVPWAQLAEYAAPEGSDTFSQAVLDGGSARNSISSSSTNESGAAKQSLENISNLPHTIGSASHRRPKLDSRHSYAGYPLKSPSTELPVSSSKRPRPVRSTTYSDTLGKHKESKSWVDPDRSGRSNTEGLLSSISETTTNISFISAHVLDVLRPLEVDVEPLITAAGVVRVLNNSSATILTRKYNILETLENSSSSKGIPSRGSQTQLYSSGDNESRTPATSKRTKSSNDSSTRASRYSDSGPRRRTNAKLDRPPSPYEDFEQVPVTPWAQSPAPSPAAIVETEDNPFFASASVKESFRKNPPEQSYTSGQQFEAIGQDTSYSIIQLPLIHPSALLSQPQRLHRFRMEQAKDKSKRSTMRSINDRGTSSERRRKVPVAILSILAPMVPFPQHLANFLRSLSPLLATSFHNASQYSNLQREVNGLVFERNRMTSSESSSLAHTAWTGSEIFSPVSDASTERLVPESAPRNISQVYGSDPRSPVLEKQKVKTPGARTPASTGKQDSYFADVSFATDAGTSQGVPSRQSSTKSRPEHLNAKTRNRSTLHSHGATFSQTHPSQPTATAAGPSEDDQSESETGSPYFKEPSSSMLRSMIDIGATQHLVAEPEAGKLLWVNSKFQAYRNRSVGLNLDDHFWNSIYPKDRKNFRAEWLHALESGEQLSQQVRMERFDGQFRWFHLKFLPLKNKLGVIKYWSGQAMDIHDLHEAEVKAAKSKEKAASEARYRAIANSLPVIVFAASVSTGMTFANTRWLSYSGQELSQALGFGFLDHVHPEDLDKCRFPGVAGDVARPDIGEQESKLKTGNTGLMRTVSMTSSAGESDTNSIATGYTESTVRPFAASRQDDDLDIPNDLLRTLAKEGVILCARDGQGNLSITTEMRLKSKDDEYRWHLVQGSYIESVNFGQGEAQWFIACTDISTQKKNESKIQEANAALENVNSALEHEMQQKMGYLTSMSHEIRTPLNSILGNLQFLIQSGLEESTLEWAHGAKEAATGMHELINDILDLSKAEAKMLKLQPHWFNPRDIAEEVIDILNPKAAGKKIELSQETDADVPLNLRGDSGRIKQVLLNLATNAVKFTNEGEVIVHCELQHDVPSNLDLPPLQENEIFVRWVVTDTGIGFKESDKKLLFKAYSQIKNEASRDIVGTGLGLLLCKTMVNLHGGDIKANSTPGQGSVFSFFARFRTRNDGSSFGMPSSALPSPAVVEPSAITTKADLQFAQSPKPLLSSSSIRESPAPLSDGSSILSMRSSIYQKSIRSSISTLDSSRPQSPLKLSLPNNQATSSGDQFSPPISSRTVYSEGDESAKYSHSAALMGASNVHSYDQSETSRVSSRFGTSVSIPNDSIDSDRASFRPPMLSILVICPASGARRITCDRIQDVVPRSAPCNIASEASFNGAYELLFRDEPVLFTHIVIRSVDNIGTLECISKMLESPNHTKTCIIIVADQDQFTVIKESLPQIDFEAFNQADRIKRVLKPAHASKLAKIFDPFNENRTVIDDPKENKRKAGARQTKEDFKLFKKALGSKGLRVVAVEDDKMQMNVLNSFLSKVCGLKTTLAYNGQECLNLYLQHGPGYFSVIVSDTEMPVLNGLRMCQKIREEESKRGWPPINIVSLSANTLAKGWTEAADAGFTDYCGKPVSFSQLGRILMELTTPNKPHTFLRDRPKPKALQKALGELEDEEDNEENDDFTEDTSRTLSSRS